MEGGSGGLSRSLFGLTPPGELSKEAAAGFESLREAPPQHPASRSNSFCRRVRRLRSLITPSLGPLITPPKYLNYTAPKTITNVVGGVIVARPPGPHQDPNKTKRPQQDTKTPASPKTPARHQDPSKTPSTPSQAQKPCEEKGFNEVGKTSGLRNLAFCEVS